MLDYARNLGNAAKQGLKRQPIGWHIILWIQILGILTWTCDDPIGHTDNSTITTRTNGTTERTEGGDWVQRFVAVVHQHSVRQETKMARSGTLLPYLAQREIQSYCFSPQKSVLLQKKCSLHQQNCVQIVFLYFPHYGTMGLLSPFVVLCTCWYHYLVLWYWAVFTNKWSKLDGRKWLPWLVHVIVQTFPTFKMNNIIILVKVINLCLMVSKDYNGSMLVEKITTHWKGSLKSRQWTEKKSMIRIRIGRYKP